MKLVYLTGAFIIACGLLGLGYFASKNRQANNELIEVKGLSERVVRAEIGNIAIKITNKDAKLDELHKKRSADKDKLMEFLKNQGVTDDEIIGVTIDTRDNQNDDNAYYGNQEKQKEKYFIAEDKFTIRTKELNKIEKIKSEMLRLSSEGIMATCEYSYSLSNFKDLKLDMMKEASENARKNAEVFIEPQNKKLGDIIYLRQGEVTIRAEIEAETTESWNSQEAKSIDKKLRLVVSAGYSKKCKCGL